MFWRIDHCAPVACFMMDKEGKWVILAHHSFLSINRTVPLGLHCKCCHFTKKIFFHQLEKWFFLKQKQLDATHGVKVYLEWNLEFYVENLNPLRPFQDLPSFLVKMGLTSLKSQYSWPCWKKFVKRQKSMSECCNFTRKINWIIIDKKNDRLW